MTSAQLAEERIDTYMGRLDDALERLSPSDREDILREIHTHIIESTAGAQNRDGAVDRVLRLLGTPEELAARYSTESMLSLASRSFSPVVLLHTSWRWAKLGTKGTAAFFLAFVGYATALAFTVAVFLKPFMPTRVGMWIGPDGFDIGMPAHPERMHELLGPYFVPVIAVAAFAVAIGTTQALRWMMRKRTPALRRASASV